MTNTITKLYFNGENYNVGGANTHELTEKLNLSGNDEFIIADSSNSYNNKKIKYSTFIDDTGSSIVYSGLKAGENLSAGDVVTINSSNQLVKVSISNQGIPHQMWIVRENANTGDDVSVDAGGISKKLSGLTAGAKYFVSSTAGQLTSTSGLGYYVGTALNTTDIDMAYSYIDTEYGTDYTFYTFADENDSYTAVVDENITFTFGVHFGGSTDKWCSGKVYINGVQDTTWSYKNNGTFTKNYTLYAGNIITMSVDNWNGYAFINNQNPKVTTSFVVKYI